ncbi:MAG: hypothetical protein K1X64_11380 [Myxococcaceae bacterium]|nr:hypothetical protein [Myxococcaceae bacterium]
MNVKFVRWSTLTALVVCTAAGGQVHAPTAGAPSDEPTPSKATGEIAHSEEKDTPPKLKGFDVELTLFDSSGVYFAAEAYTQTLSLEITPSYAFGKQWFKGSWGEKLSASVRLPIEAELTGNDPRFRGRSFASPSLFDFPEQVVIDENSEVTTSGSVEGLAHQPVLLGDLWLGVSHNKLYVIPKLEVTLAANMRAVIPTSVASRNSGLITTLSLGLSAEREFGPLTLSYVFRPAKYFYSRSSPALIPLTETVQVNGRETTLWRPDSTGNTNPHFGLSHAVELSAKLPLGFSLSASYVLTQVAPLPLSGCAVEGIPTADVCRDGPLVSDLRGSAWREDHWFSAQADLELKAFTVSLGVSTYRPLRDTNGSVSQPFWSANRNNYTTVFLSVATSLSQVAELYDPP